MNKTLQTVYIHENSNKTDAYYSMRQAILLTQEEYNTLIQENTYLKAELEANEDKVYTQEEIDREKEESYQNGLKH